MYPESRISQQRASCLLLWCRSCLTRHDEVAKRKGRGPWAPISLEMHSRTVQQKLDIPTNYIKLSLPLKSLREDSALKSLGTQCTVDMNKTELSHNAVLPLRMVWIKDNLQETSIYHPVLTVKCVREKWRLYLRCYTDNSFHLVICF